MRMKVSDMIVCLRFFVTLQEIALFLYIKAVWGIEGKWGYDLETSIDFYADYSCVSIYFTTFAHIIHNR